MEDQMKQMRDQARKRDAEIKTLKQHLALLTSDFKYNLKLLEDRDFELDQSEALLEQIEKIKKSKEQEMEHLSSEIANYKMAAERDAAQIRDLEATLSQYKESVRSVRERLEEALQLRDQELTCHRSELEALQTKLQQQSEALKVQEKGLSDAMKACERSWSQRYSECHKTVMTLVAEQDSLLQEKLVKDREMENMQKRVVELQKSVDELTHMADASRKECVSLTSQLKSFQERTNDKLGELELEKQESESNLRKKILEEYDGKIAELLAQLQSIEYAVSLERREAQTRFTGMEAQHAEQTKDLQKALQDLRRERDVLLDKAAKLEKELWSLKNNFVQLRNQGSRLTEREARLAKDVESLQASLRESQTLLEKSEVEKAREISLLHDVLREARHKEQLVSTKEVEYLKRIEVMEKFLDETRTKVDILSKKETEQTKEIMLLQKSLELAKTQRETFSQKNAEHLQEIAILKKSLTEARNQEAMFSRKQAENMEEMAILKQSLCDARNHGDVIGKKNGELAKDVENLRQYLRAAKTREDLMRRKLDGQADQMVSLDEALRKSKAEAEQLFKAEATHAEEISALRMALAETQKQADASFKHAQHLIQCNSRNDPNIALQDAIFEVTQAEARRRVEIKECVSSLITGAQDHQEFGMRHDKRVDDVITKTATKGLQDSASDNPISPNGRKVQALLESEVSPRVSLEEENRYLKARVEELQGENFKVGMVISDLRNELETSGLLPQSKAPNPHGGAPYQQNATKSTAQDEAMSRQSDTPACSEGKPESPHLMARSKIIDRRQEKDIITLSEKEELRTLRSLLEDVHARQALFYRQMESVDDTRVKGAHQTGALAGSPLDYTCDTRTLLDGSGYLAPEMDKPHQSVKLEVPARVLNDRHRKPPAQPGNNSSSTYQDIDSTEINLCKTPSELKGAQKVSAEVSKLNEQIARVRQQLTSLCSTDQSSSPLPDTLEEAKSAKSIYVDISPCPDQSIRCYGSDRLAGKQTYGHKRREEKERPFHYHASLEQTTDDQREQSSRRASGAKDEMHYRKQQNLDWEDETSDMPTMKGMTNRKCRIADHSHRTRDASPSNDKHVGSKNARPSARDSLGTRVRTKVTKKLPVKAASVTSSRSDVVCSHCRKYLTDDNNMECLQSSSPDVSYTPSPETSDEANQASQRENVDPSSCSEGKETILDSSCCAQRNTTNSKTPVVLPAARTGTWSDSDDSRLTSASEHRCNVHPSDTPRTWLETGDRRGIQPEGKPRSRPQVTKDDMQLRQPSDTARKKGARSSSTPSRSARIESYFPANVRERVDSHHKSLKQYRASPSRAGRVHC